MNERMSKRHIITLVIFIVVTLTAGLFGCLIDQIIPDQPEGETLGLTVWFVLPLLTGIVLLIINKDIKQIGILPRFKNNIKWYIVAVLVFPCIMLVDIVIAMITGCLIVKEEELGSLLGAMFTAFLFNCVRNIFEEFPWRGCLLPFLEKIGMNDWFLYLINGLVWGMWHIPYYLYYSPDEYYTDISRPMMMLVAIVTMLFWAPLFVEMRRLTNSVWPCLIMHSIEDAVPTMLFVTANVLRIKKDYSVMLDPISGIVPTVIIFTVGMVLRRYRIRRELAVATTQSSRTAI